MFEETLSSMLQLYGPWRDVGPPHSRPRRWQPSWSHPAAHSYKMENMAHSRMNHIYIYTDMYSLMIYLFITCYNYFYVSQTTAYSNLFKTWKKRDKSKKRKNQKANQQNPKNTKTKLKGKQRGKKKEIQKGKMVKNGFVHLHVFFLHLFCFFDLLFFCFYFFCFFFWASNGQIHFFPFFFPFLTFLFLSIYFAYVFFSVL